MLQQLAQLLPPVVGSKWEDREREREETNWVNATRGWRRHILWWPPNFSTEMCHRRLYIDLRPPKSGDCWIDGCTFVRKRCWAPEGRHPGETIPTIRTIYTYNCELFILHNPHTRRASVKSDSFFFITPSSSRGFFKANRSRRKRWDEGRAEEGRDRDDVASFTCEA